MPSKFPRVGLVTRVTADANRQQLINGTLRREPTRSPTARPIENQYFRTNFMRQRRLSVVLMWTGCVRRLSARLWTAPNCRRRRLRKWSRGCRTVPRCPSECAGVTVLWGRQKYVLLIESVPSGEYSKMADLEAVLADVSYLMAMEKSKCTPAARASKKILLPDPR